jgi:hypothetical protein
MIPEKLRDMVKNVHNSEKLLIGGDLYDHIITTRRGFERVHRFWI